MCQSAHGENGPSVSAVNTNALVCSRNVPVSCAANTHIPRFPTPHIRIVAKTKMSRFREDVQMMNSKMKTHVQSHEVDMKCEPLGTTAMADMQSS